MVNLWLIMVNNWNNNIVWLVVTGTMEWIMTFHSVGNVMSSQLTNSMILQRGWLKPPISNGHFWDLPARNNE